MKKLIYKIFGLFTIAALLILNISVSIDEKNSDISLDSIVITAFADGEGGSTTCYKGGGGVSDGYAPICNQGCPYHWLTNYSKCGTCNF